ncbi:hypothetical protein A0O28_0001520 [Trichoderma guizhouense]|uniref:DNA2/NAM7 helicase-like C-terminal domain-containing protein n=1 Tax=Trichoderma guizhouense TaxID=1491466 RepID=A0A1T3CG44_9HYPO|nr:hypothetical protein A0O28_0001520 [Trichoderma guizhouense]
MIFVDVTDGQERKQNASYVNPTNARFVAELVSRLAASAPMFSAKSYMDDRFDTERYKGKKGKGKDQDREERIQQFLRTYEWGRILIVTGHEAEVVICDMVRTDKPGFMVEDARLAVMTTRARALTIIVGKADVIKGKDARSLRALYDYLKDRDAIVKVLGWNEFCGVCLLPGHQKTACQTVVNCAICNGKHAGRRCPKIGDRAVADLCLFENVAPLDDFHRAAFASIKHGKLPEGVKKMKANRKDQQETATQDAHKAYMKMITTEYRDYIHGKKKPEVKDESIAGPSAQRVEKGKGPQQEAPIVKGPTPVARPSTQRVEKNGGPEQKVPVAKGPAVKQSQAKAPSSSTVGPSKQHNQKRRGSQQRAPVAKGPTAKQFQAKESFAPFQLVSLSETKKEGERSVADEDASVKIDKGKGKAVATEEDESDLDTDDEPVVGSDFKKPAKQLKPAPAPAPAPKTVSMIVWTAPQNTQVADAVEHLKSAMPNKKIVRVHSYALELRSFMNANPEAPESTPITKDTPSSHKQSIKLINKFRLN